MELDQALINESKEHRRTKKKAWEKAEILCECEAEQTDPESSPFATSS